MLWPPRACLTPARLHMTTAAARALRVIGMPAISWASRSGPAPLAGPVMLRLFTDEAPPPAWQHRCAAAQAEATACVLLAVPATRLYLQPNLCVGGCGGGLGGGWLL